MTANQKKDKALGMPYGTACNRLRKAILFDCVTRLGLNVCYCCHKKIESIDAFSIEHKIAWLDADNSVELFFDLDNITFSHLSCNSLRRRYPKRTHGKGATYAKGCRCDKCREAHRVRISKQRAARK